MTGQRRNTQASPTSTAARRVGLWLAVLALSLGGAMAIDMTRQALTKDQVQWRSLTAMDGSPAAPAPRGDHSATVVPAQITTASAPVLNDARPRLIRFTADWCHACTDMKARVFAQTDVADRIHQRFEPYSVDLSSPSPQKTSLAQRHRVTYLPTLLITDGRGNELARMERAASSAQEFLEWLDRGESRWASHDK